MLLRLALEQLLYLSCLKRSLFDFSSPYDSYFIKDLGPDFVDAMKDDRMTLFH